MSHFYGTLNGQAGPATRRGSKNSGLIVKAASWAGSVQVRLWHDEKTGLDMFSVDQKPWQGAGDTHCVAHGVVGQAVDRTGQPPKGVPGLAWNTA